ncbi:MAG: AMP-binding protein [Neisseriaceae bacterium]|nr:AMP-binding protein [Neisseriaceae bacterium]MBP6862420.1 AMP-binding protein [Neisseriaceae bacterium]
MTKTHWLIDRCADYATKEALVFNNQAHDYQSLQQHALTALAYLRQAELPPSSVISVEGDFTPYTCAVMLALISEQHLIVPIGAVPDGKRAQYLSVAQVTHRIQCQGQHYALSPITPAAQDSRHPHYQTLQSRQHAGLILFSSGTTGTPKASVLDFHTLIDKHQALRSPKRTLAFLALDHIGGINTLLHTLSQGGTLISPLTRTPESVFAAIAKWRVEILPTTPTFLNMALISGVLAQADTSSLKLISYGTEPMPASVLTHLNTLLPSVTLKQTYGLSEVGILPTQSKNNQELWMKLGSQGFEHKIINHILWIKSEFAMLGYLNAAAPFDADGFFNTEDLVAVDGDYVKILGRTSEVINVGGEKVYPAEVENVILQADNVADVTVTGEPNPITGMGIKALILLKNPEDFDAFRTRLFQHCALHLEPFKIPMIYEFSDQAHYSSRFKKSRAALSRSHE